MTNKFTFYKQLNMMDCGPTCLRMISKYHGKHYNIDTLRNLTGFNKLGVSLLGISEAAEKIGFRTRAVKLTYQQLMEEAERPCILHWHQNHFVVLMPETQEDKKYNLKIADPANGIISLTKKDFLLSWASTESENGTIIGTALLLEPTPHFYAESAEKEKKLSWALIAQYLHKSTGPIIKVFIALLITSLLQLAFPFLTQSIVDIGINTKDVHFIVIILFAQLMLVLSRSLVDFIRNRLLLNISIIVNLSILSDFWIKLTRLPLSYYDEHHDGDILQRLQDNKYIQNFLTGSALHTMFSLLNFVIYSFVLIFYSFNLFLIFLTGSALYFLWIQFFLKIRRKLNYQTFHISSEENSKTLQLIQGMQELRLNNAEKLKRWDWENLQVSIFKLNFKSLNYSQIQQIGAMLINQVKDIFLTFFVATLVIKGEITFGAMLAVQYIIGQLSSPIEQLINFIQNGQDAKISMERLNEIHQLEDEEDMAINYLSQLPSDKTIYVQHLSFTYPGPENEPVLEDLNFKIPVGKVTAIVGASGSGKTTLVKLLLKIYTNYKGEIKVGETNLKYLSSGFWRTHCGTVLQNGYMFNDTIARNICLGDEVIDQNKLVATCETANILSFIESLPNGFQTKLGAEGTGLSQGQKQRLLIARAIYKDPEYLLFDEATNSLDATNELKIVENLNQFFRKKTVIVIAHRLSTVKNADNIIVLDGGRILEQGSHHDLVAKKGKYFNLVKDQMDLEI